MHNFLFMFSVIAILLLSMMIFTFCPYRLSNEQYDRLKKIVHLWSAIMTFLGVMVATFDFPYEAETVTVVAAIGAFLAKVLESSKKVFVEGTTQTEEDWVENGDEDEQQDDI